MLPSRARRVLSRRFLSPLSCSVEAGGGCDLVHERVGDGKTDTILTSAPSTAKKEPGLAPACGCAPGGRVHRYSYRYWLSTAESPGGAPPAAAGGSTPAAPRAESPGTPTRSVPPCFGGPELTMRSTSTPPFISSPAVGSWATTSPAGTASLGISSRRPGSRP